MRQYDAIPVLRRPQRLLLLRHLHPPLNPAPRHPPRPLRLRLLLRHHRPPLSGHHPQQLPPLQRLQQQHHLSSQLHLPPPPLPPQLLLQQPLPHLRQRHRRRRRLPPHFHLLHLRRRRLLHLLRRPGLRRRVQRLPQLRQSQRRGDAGGAVGRELRCGAPVGVASGAGLPVPGRLRGGIQRHVQGGSGVGRDGQTVLLQYGGWLDLGPHPRHVTDSCESTGGCGGTNHGPLIAGLVSGVGAALLVGAAGFLLYRRQRRIREARERLAKERQEILNFNNTSGRSAKNFTGKEIKKATANFSPDNLLGSGGYGEVYKGVLEDGTPVAVKCAKLGNTKSTDQVLNEVRILSQVNHRSLVRLLGCCVDLEQPLMVYEFIPNGTLFDHLHGLRPPLPWRRRLSIAHQTAEGLAYLHSSAVPPIYHRDVKSSNILLDEKLNGKVSDFGLSRLAESDLSHISTCAQGTLGYLDPEYYRNYQLTDKSDVYSFGVVLLELLTSQKAIDFNRGPDDVNLAVYVQRKVEEERLMEVVDGSVKEGATQLELDTMKALGFLAMGCLEERRQNRPSMKEVTEEIEYIMSIEAGGEEQQHGA
uniref:Wall-associated receptor kinase-like 20 isoform X2 n=1 Tax=Elaeis guineensis var. tenera TaxID=51953 RepID=A0A8N4F3K8_ELAGV|nr:wall-associated receptor kinase-like 20 isoform X2 [Elaeis guineensis]